MNNQSFKARSTPVDLNSEVHYYLFMVNLDICDGSCTTVEDPCGITRVPNKIKM